MAYFAVMSGSSVSNVIVAEIKENAELATGSECIEYTEADGVGIGWTRVDGEWVAPKQATDSQA